EPAEAFVGEQQLWSGRQRFGKFELLQTRGAEAVDGGMTIGRQADHAKRLFGGLIRLGAAVAALAVIAGQFDVLEDAQPMKRPRDLEGAADAAVDDAMRGCPCDL